MPLLQKSQVDYDVESTIRGIAHKLLERTPIPRKFRLLVSKSDLKEYMDAVIEAMTSEQKIDTLHEVYTDLDSLFATHTSDWLKSKLSGRVNARSELTKKALERFGLIVEDDGPL